MNHLIKLALIFIPFIGFTQSLEDEISGVSVNPAIVSFIDSTGLQLCDVTLYFLLEDSSSIASMSLVISNTQTTYFDETFSIANLSNNSLVAQFTELDNFFEITFSGIVVPPDYSASYSLTDSAGNNSSLILID